MEDIDIQALAEKYKDIDTVLYPVIDGGSVVGQEVSSTNQLIYIIKDADGNITPTLATEVDVEQVIHKSAQDVTTTTIISKLAPKNPLL